MQINTLLKQLGFSIKEIQVYLSLLNLGPSSVRTIAQQAKVNRGTTYNILKSLIKNGLVSYYHQDKHQYFLAESPDRLKNFINEEINELNQSKHELEKALPELQSIYNKAEQKPVVKYYEGTKGVKTILEDVLEKMSEAEVKEYYVYSASDIRKYLYQDFPNFAKERIKRKIKCKVIAIGSGGQLWGMDERRWISKSEGSPTYMILYDKRLALISLNRENIPIGMIVSDQGIWQTNKMIFEHVWKTLK